MRCFLAALLLGLLLPLTTRAQEPNQAGLVIQYGDGHIETSCVSFEEAEISGFELLQRSGLPLTYDAQAGTLVCSIGNEGCDFPAEGCLCQCSGVGSCIYWSYHRLDEAGRWQYSQLGAAATLVHPGEVNGWRWGEGGANNAPPPVGVTFESICAAPAPTPTRVIPATATVKGDAVAIPTPIPDTTPTTGVPSTPPAEGEVSSRPAAPYLFFVLLLLVLGGSVLWARRS